MTLEARLGTLLPHQRRMTRGGEWTPFGLVAFMVTIIAEGRFGVTITTLIRYSPGIRSVLLLELSQMRYRRAMTIVTELLQVTHLTLAQIFNGQIGVVPPQEVGGRVIAVGRTGTGHEIEFGRMANRTLAWTRCFHQTMAFTTVTSVHGHYHRRRWFLDIVTIGARELGVRCMAEDERSRSLFHGGLQILVAAHTHLQIQGKALLMMAIGTELHLMTDETVGFVLLSRWSMLPDKEDGVRHGRLMAFGAELIIMTVVTLRPYVE